MKTKIKIKVSSAGNFRVSEFSFNLETMCFQNGNPPLQTIQNITSLKLLLKLSQKPHRLQRISMKSNLRVLQINRKILIGHFPINRTISIKNIFKISKHLFPFFLSFLIPPQEKLNPCFREMYTCFGCGTKRGLTRILVISQLGPMFSHIIQKESARAFHLCG